MMVQRAETDLSEAGEGARLEQARGTRKSLLLAALMGAGGLIGLAISLSGGKAPFTDPGGWPPAMAIGIALAFVVAAVGGGLILARHTDEVELQAQYKAIAFAASVYVLLYPVWFFLWMGGLVPEPMHGAIFAAFWVSLAGASLFYRVR